MPLDNADIDHGEANPGPAVPRQDKLDAAQRHLTAARAAAQAGDRSLAEREMRLAQVEMPGTDSLIDPQTGQIRDKTWWERNGPTVRFLIEAGIAVGGGFWLSGLNAATGGATGSGVGVGETGAVTGLPGGSAGLPVGNFAGGVAPEISGAGLYAPGSAGFDALSETQLNPGPSSVSSLGEPPTTTGLPNGSAGLPGSQPAPQAASDLMANGSAVSGQTPGAPTMPTSSSLVSRQGIGGFSWGDIVGGALSYVQARQSANASQEAAQAQADAVKAGIAEQARQYDLSRGDFLGNQAYTRQQITGLAPYQQLGSTALGNLYSLTGHTAPAGLGAPGVAAQAPPLAPQTTQAPSPRGGYADTAGLNGGGLLTIQAPTGETRQVPAGQAQHYVSLGGRVIPNG